MSENHDCGCKSSSSFSCIAERIFALKKILFPDKLNICRIIVFTGAVIFWYPTLIFGILNGEKFYFFSNLVINYIYSKSIWIGITTILLLAVFTIFMLFNERIFLLMDVVLFSDIAIQGLCYIFNWGIYWNIKPNVHELNGEYICDFFAPILSNAIVRDNINAIAQGDKFIEGKVFFVFFSLGLAITSFFSIKTLGSFLDSLGSFLIWFFRKIKRPT